jgi:hypothetical protein
MMGFLNSEEENQRLEAAKIELKSRRKKWNIKYIK